MTRRGVESHSLGRASRINCATDGPNARPVTLIMMTRIVNNGLAAEQIDRRTDGHGNENENENEDDVETGWNLKNKTAFLRCHQVNDHNPSDENGP